MPSRQAGADVRRAVPRDRAASAGHHRTDPDPGVLTTCRARRGARSLARQTASTRSIASISVSAVMVVDPARVRSALPRRSPRRARPRRLACGPPPELPDDNPLRIVPTWCAEVLSPSTAPDDRTLKLPLYASTGVAHVWLIDPVLRTIEVYESSDGRPTLVATARDGDVVRLPRSMRALARDVVEGARGASGRLALTRFQTRYLVKWGSIASSASKCLLDRWPASTPRRPFIAPRTSPGRGSRGTAHAACWIAPEAADTGRLSSLISLPSFFDRYAAGRSRCIRGCRTRRRLPTRRAVRAATAPPRGRCHASRPWRPCARAGRIRKDALVLRAGST